LKLLEGRRQAARPLASIAALIFIAAAGSAQPQERDKPASGRPTAGKTSDKATAKATPQRQQDLQRQQRDLQAQLAKLKRQLAASESSRSEASEALASADIAISRVNRRLHELGLRRERLEQQLAVLVAREREAAGRQGRQQRQLDQLLREQHRLGLRDHLHLWMEGGDPNQPGRDASYLGYLIRDTDASVSQLQTRRLELASLQAQTEDKRAEIAKLTDDETQSRQLLEIEQLRRQRALAKASKEVLTQRQSIVRLERDEQRLGALIDQISRVLAEQTRREAERARQQAERETAARRRARTPEAAKGHERDPSPPPTVAFEPSSSVNFSQQKGKLSLPVQGTVTARFGAPRRADGGAGPTWKGVFVKAPVGATVRSIGDGQIVFADWMRGFGNLLVIDHGDGYLSIYGNNEALLRNVGDKVAVGEIVASVGNTGASETPGLYFELRFQGRPFDPLGWVAAR
jgi:murein hydrolase activator